ncbi:MAG: hypothetical protein AB1640_00840 [bacterium]
MLLPIRTFAVVCGFLSALSSVAARADEQIAGAIEKNDPTFVREYEDLDYKGHMDWKEWGKGLRALGWIGVRGDSGEPKDLLLLVVDTRTQILRVDGSKGGFEDLLPGRKVSASYRMGWDALHATEVRVTR